jgi:hypothetical protein
MINKKFRKFINTGILNTLNILENMKTFVSVGKNEILPKQAVLKSNEV